MKKSSILLVLFFSVFICTGAIAQNTNTKLTVEDQLGLKSGADPTKALRGKAPGSSRKKGRPVVFIQFGHNDSGSLNMGRARASLKGNGDNDTTVIMESTGKPETVHSFGWYMRKYAQDVKAKGATPVLLSHIPRNMYTTKDSTNVIRNDKDLGKWTKEAAAMEKVPFIDLNQLIADKYDKLGKNVVPTMFYGDHTHTSLAGAQLNAKTMAEGIKASKDKQLKKLKKALKK